MTIWVHYFYIYYLAGRGGLRDRILPSRSGSQVPGSRTCPREMLPDEALPWHWMTDLSLKDAGPGGGYSLSRSGSSVHIVRDFLDSELAKYESWEEAKKSNLMSSLDSTNEQSFQALKTKGVGQTTILKFLGGGWKQWRIQSAIKVKELHQVFTSSGISFHGPCAQSLEYPGT